MGIRQISITRMEWSVLELFPLLTEWDRTYRWQVAINQKEVIVCGHWLVATVCRAVWVYVRERYGSQAK